MRRRPWSYVSALLVLLIYLLVGGTCAREPQAPPQAGRLPVPAGPVWATDDISA